MAIQNAYLQGVYEGLAKRNPEQKEFLQAVEEVLESLEPVVAAHPEYEKAGLIERLVDWLGMQLPSLFLATGFCTSREWEFLSMSMANWSALFFAGIVGYAILLFRSNWRG